MIRRILPPLAVGAVILASIAAAQTAPALKGYLDADFTPQTVRILPPPPSAGSGRMADDTAIFQSTRSLAGSPRWALAASDADLSQREGLYACAIGMKLDASTTPALDRLMVRVAIDARGVVDPPKDTFARARPFVDAPGDPAICVAKTPDLAKSASYPSGHSTLSWAWGLILAELMPDRATDILMRARSIGESRIVCGVHYLSDVQEGRTNGSVLVAALHANPAFRADLDAARAEVAAARSTPHIGPESCMDADQAAAHPPY